MAAITVGSITDITQ